MAGLVFTLLFTTIHPEVLRYSVACFTLALALWLGLLARSSRNIHQGRKLLPAGWILGCADSDNDVGQLQMAS